jgi:hypothetical protein
MTKLQKPVTRLTSKRYNNRPVVITIAPAGAQSEALISLRLLGQRTGYLIALSDVYRQAALVHGQKLFNAKRAARKAGIPWKRAKRDFDKANSIPKYESIPQD